MFKTILGLETSCDETAAAILERDPSTSFGRSGRIRVLSNVVTSSASLQSKYGGVIPEQAAREQIKLIIPVIEETINDSRLTIHDIDAIAVTYGPGLIGSLLVGVETAKTLSIIWNKPLIPVNHLIGHFYANWIQPSAISHQLSDKKQKQSEDRRLTTDDYPSFLCLGLLASGGHTDLVLFEDHGKYEYLGGTRDDAAGECFDKCARLLSLPYPGGPAIAQSAMKLKIENLKLKINLPRPLINEETFDFSFSGLKTAFLREVEQLKTKEQFSNSTIQQLAYEVQQAIIDVLVSKTLKAAKKYNIGQIMIAGGVASNEKLTSRLKFKIQNSKFKIKLHVPPPHLCTDNGAMIAAAAFFIKPIAKPLMLQADPNLSLEKNKDYK